VRHLAEGADAVELLGELKGSFGLGPGGQEAAGLPAHWPLGTSSLQCSPPATSPARLLAPWSSLPRAGCSSWRPEYDGANIGIV